MYARTPTFKIGPDKIDAAIRLFEESSLPQLQTLSGFKGASLLVDREQGMFRVIGYWEDRQAVDSSEARARGLRDELTQKLGAQLVSIEIWEVPVDVYPEKLEAMAGAGAARAR
jgi:hypothetical protein